MEPISELKRILNESLNWNKARVDCLARLLLALVKVKTVNLREVAVAFKSNAKIDSKYKRLKRFFSGFKMDEAVLARWLFNLFFSPEEKVYLTIDRTNWYFGKTKINILLLGVCYEGIAIPLFWMLFNKAGNASGKEHAILIKRFICLFGKEKIAGVLADREFANKDFFNYLTTNKIPFYIRVKEGSLVKFFYGKRFRVKQLFAQLKHKEQTGYIQPVYIHGQKLFVGAGRSHTGEWLIVATNQSSNNAAAIYLRRWEIENLFQSLKGRGFRFEETHLIKQERIHNLMSLLAICFCWCHKIGEWRAESKPIRWNRHRTSRRPQNSFFRYGLDWLREIVLDILAMKKAFKRCLKLLFPPPNSPIYQFQRTKI